MIQTMIHRSSLEVTQERFGIFKQFFEMLMAVEEQQQTISVGDDSAEKVLKVSW